MAAVGDIGAGHMLGRYELLSPIAQGGMAVVWAARMGGARGFQKIVAIKSMLPALSDDQQFEDMFLAEAGLASRIRHPNVCEILDLGEEAGTLYIVMEWVDGEPLSALNKAARKSGGMPLSVATRVILQAATGLHAAHELKDEEGHLVGVVHRDVSPQNILVTYDGVVKIVDFGVAKAAAHAEESHTKAGQVKGKVPFMSPEQAMGKPVDRRTDIFALGIVLYQLATGQHPFRGDNDLVTMNRICGTAPVENPKNYVPTLPDGLADVIAQALEKDINKRFETMHEMARALEKALAEIVASGDDVDLAEFVRGAVGDRGEKRKAAIKEALRLADLRSPPSLSGTRSMTGVGMQALSPAALAPPVIPTEENAGDRVSLTGTGRISRPSTSSGVSFVTPPATPSAIAAQTAAEQAAAAAAEVPAPPRSNKRFATIAVIATVAVGLAAGVVLVTRSNPEPAAAAPPAATTPPPPTPSAVTPPTPEPTAAASADTTAIDINSLPEVHPDAPEAVDSPTHTTKTVSQPKTPTTGATAKTPKPKSTVTGPTVRDPGF